MRRFCSILALIVVLCPLAVPLWASGSVTPTVMSCHRVPLQNAQPSKARSAHHCHDMANMMPQGSDTGPAVDGSGHSEQCPMNCCVQAVPPTVAALPAASLLPQLHVIETSVHAFAITFSSVGFSSHTDRGPPTL
jgi:hypothetical protein